MLACDVTAKHEIILQRFDLNYTAISPYKSTLSVSLKGRQKMLLECQIGKATNKIHLFTFHQTKLSFLSSCLRLNEQRGWQCKEKIKASVDVFH